MRTRFTVETTSLKGAPMHRAAIVISTVALFVLGSVAHVAAQESDTILDLLLEAIDDTTCGDGIGRTYRGESFVSAVQHDDVEDFLARHESCAGASGAAAAAGLNPLPIGLTSRCSAAIEIPGVEYEWIICALGFTAKEELTAPIHIELDEFFLFTHDDQKLASYANSDLYVSQRNDMSGGIDMIGSEPVFGTVAFPAFPGQVDGPFLVWWETTGDYIVADELEPSVADAFLYDIGIR